MGRSIPALAVALLLLLTETAFPLIVREFSSPIGRNPSLVERPLFGGIVDIFTEWDVYYYDNSGELVLLGRQTEYVTRDFTDHPVDDPSRASAFFFRDFVDWAQGKDIPLELSSSGVTIGQPYSQLAGFAGEPGLGDFLFADFKRLGIRVIDKYYWKHPNTDQRVYFAVGGPGQREDVDPPNILPAVATVVDVCEDTTISFELENGPAKWSARGLPRGLSIDKQTGVISGTPTREGEHEVAVRATNSAGSDTETFTLTVNLPAPQIINQPDSLWLKKGELASFSVEASPNCGNYNSYQWRSTADRFKPNPYVSDIPRATSKVINLGPADWDLVGAYDVQISNASGSTSSTPYHSAFPVTLRMYDGISSALCVLPALPEVPASDEYVFNASAISAGFGVVCSDFEFITQDGFLTLGDANPLRLYAIPTTLTPQSGQTGTSLFGRKFYRTPSEGAGVKVPEEAGFSVGSLWVSKFEYVGIARNQPGQIGIGLIYRFYYVIHKDGPTQVGFSSDFSSEIEASAIIHFNAGESAFLLDPEVGINGVESVDWPRSEFEGLSATCSDGLITISALDQPHDSLDWSFPPDVADPDKMAFAAQFSMDGKNAAFDRATDMSLFSGPLQVGTTSAQIPVFTIFSSWYPSADYSDPRGVFNQYLPDALPGAIDLKFFAVEEESGTPALFLEPPVLEEAELHIGFSSTPVRFVSLTMVTSGGRPTHYRASESGDFSDAEWLPWYGDVTSFMLSDGAGSKTVYVQVRNDVGESQIASTNIKLRKDETAPPPPLPPREDGVGASVDLDLVSLLGEGEFKVTSLPKGMQYDRENQRIVGAPQKAGNFKIKVTHVDPSGKKIVREIETTVSPLSTALTGTFFALVERSDDLFQGMGGALELRVNESGVCSGRFLIGGRGHNFRATLEVQDDGSARIALQEFDRGRQGSLNADISISATGEVTGTITSSAGSVSLSGARAPWSRLTPLPDFWLRKAVNLTEWNVSEDIDSLPEGSALAHLKVSNHGKATLAGRLPGGAGFKSSTVVYSDGSLPVYSTVKPGGDVMGSYDLTEASEPDGQASWLRLPDERKGDPGFGPAAVDIWKLDPL